MLTMINAHQNSISGSTYDAFAIGSPGATLDKDVFLVVCKHVTYIDRLPFIGRRNLKYLQTCRIMHVSALQHQGM